MHEVLEQNSRQQLPGMESGLQALLDSIDDCAVLRLDPNGNVVTWSSGAQRIKGYRAAEILGQHFSRFYTAEDIGRRKPTTHLRLALEQGRFQDRGWRVRRDGSRFWAHVIITPLKDERGQLQGFAKVTRDITERKTAEDALRQSERLLDGFFSASPAGLAILDRNLRYQRVNETMAAIDGASAAAHLGRTVREVIPELADQVEPHVKRVLATGRRTLNHELCGPMPSEEGAIGHWVANYFPIVSEAGEITQIGCVVLDITDCRRAEESLRRLSGRLMELQDQERRRIARELHDSIGQCLTAIKINLDFLDRDLPGHTLSPKAEKALAEALKLADQCSADTRTISYLLHPPLLDERGLASAIRWYSDGFAQRSGIQLSIDLPAEGVRLPQPLETTLFRIVQESLTNLHRHSGSNTAEIRLLIDAESVELEVRDRGHGMPAASLQRCNSHSRVPGVGIAGMRERVRQFGGTLEIQSTSQGTTVRATLPIGGEA
jgi:PAS domain S-box-containing protein